jgi:carbon monoxide dehydrogenase subunit G
MQSIHHHTFDAPIDKCWEMFHDPESHVAKFEGMGHHGVTVIDQEVTPGHLHLEITREVDVDGIPGFARKWIKPRNTVVSVDDWRELGDGTYGGEFSLDTSGVPVDIAGTTLLEPDGETTQYTVTVEIKVNVPLVGGKLASFSRSIVDRQLEAEFALGDTWLAEH